MVFSSKKKMSIYELMEAKLLSFKSNKLYRAYDIILALKS